MTTRTVSAAIPRDVAPPGTRFDGHGLLCDVEHEDISEGRQIDDDPGVCRDHAAETPRGCAARNHGNLPRIGKREDLFYLRYVPRLDDEVGLRLKERIGHDRWNITDVMAVHLSFFRFAETPYVTRGLPEFFRHFHNRQVASGSAGKRCIINTR